MKKHWSRVERLHEAVTNPNIIVKGTHSYYSDCWDDGFEASVVRYLCGDEESQHWELPWKIDQLKLVLPGHHQTGLAWRKYRPRAM